NQCAFQETFDCRTAIAFRGGNNKQKHAADRSQGQAYIHCQRRCDCRRVCKTNNQMKSHLLITGVLIAVISGLITLNIFFQQSLQMDMAEQFNRQQLLLSKLIADNIKSFIHHEREELVLIAHLMSETDVRNGRDFLKIKEKLRTVHKEMVDDKFGLINTRGTLLFFQGKTDSLLPTVTDIIKQAQGMEPNTTRLMEATPFLYIISPV